MIDKFGSVMVYVKDVRKVADFWVTKIGFKELSTNEFDDQLISIELTPKDSSDTHLVLFDKEFVRKYSPEINLLPPSILFTTYDLNQMHQDLLNQGVKVGQIMEMGGKRSFNFPDPEDNYFAVREIEED